MSRWCCPPSVTSSVVDGSHPNRSWCTHRVARARAEPKGTPIGVWASASCECSSPAPLLPVQRGRRSTASAGFGARTCRRACRCACIRHVRSNELVLLDQVLQQRQRERDTPLRDDDAFELFACEQALRNRDLSAEEVAEGVLGGDNDGGIDGVFVFLGETALSEDSDVFQDDFVSSRVPTGVRLALDLVQAKREESFSETALDKVASSARRLLSLAEDDATLDQLYSPALVTRMRFFRDAFRRLATRHPQVDIRFMYIIRGRVETVNAKVAIKARDLEAQFRGVVSGVTASVEFLGAAELGRRINTVPSYTITLTCQENATSGGSDVAIVKLRDYMQFLCDERGALRKNIFDLNVRDYQGDVDVNREIRQSLEETGGPEFWWLNNGVTIVCSKASGMGKTYALDDVQVVNGLQTSQTIHAVLKDADPLHPAFDRSVLVRTLVTGDDPATRDRVIRATNRQTSVPAASLRATDNIQRDIEMYFLQRGWFYDRRKNFYRNSGKSPERIVSIPLLAQAFMAMGLSRPDDSRARPSSLLKRDEDYHRIFSRRLPLEVYLWLAKSQKKVDAYLLSDGTVTTPERTNVRFYVSMLAAAKLLGTRVYAPAQLLPLATTDRDMAEAELRSCLSEVRGAFQDIMGLTGDAADKIAKGGDLVDRLLQQVLPPMASKRHEACQPGL